MLYQITTQTGAALFNISNPNSMQNLFPDCVSNKEFSKSLSEEKQLDKTQKLIC